MGSWGREAAAGRPSPGSHCSCRAVPSTGCGSGSDPSPPTGVDGLQIPTPSIDPDDFVTGVDNPWLPLPVGAAWEYDVTGSRPGHRDRDHARGPRRRGRRHHRRPHRAGPGPRSPDRGHRLLRPGRRRQRLVVRSGGRCGWPGRTGAEAGLVMAANPRVGDGYRQAFAPGGRRPCARRCSASTRASTVPDGEYDDLVTVEVTSPLTGATQQVSYAEGVGLGAPRDGRGGARDAARARRVRRALAERADVTEVASGGRTWVASELASGAGQPCWAGVPAAARPAAGRGSTAGPAGPTASRPG